VELTHFERVNDGSGDVARVGLRIFVYNRNTSLAYREFTATKPVPEDDMDAFAGACADALEEILGEIAAAVDKHLPEAKTEGGD
jgi:ABC-type uncharacterized transport system auxiliary subunit